MKKVLLAIFLLVINSSYGQDDLLDILNSETPENATDDIVTATFKGTRIVNGHSIENKKDKELEFIIAHRFGRVNTGLYDLFGMDNANIRFAFEYGFTDDITIGIGRSSFEKTYDSFIKYRLLNQKNGENSFPVAISLLGSVALKTLKDYDPSNKRSFAESLFYVGQVLIAKKINSSSSFQISPTYIHRNTVKIDEDPHDIFALGFGGRIKLSKRVSLNSEYYYAFDESKSINARNSLAFGVDIETGGHVFQIIISNAITMIEKSFISETTGNFFNGDIHLGFNLSRTF